MAGFAELMAKRGMTPISSSSSGPRQKALSQANSMLSKISKYTDASQMNSETSNQNWWGTASRNGLRRITVRYDNKVVPIMSVDVADDLSSVRAAIEDFKAIIQEVDDDAWTVEEKRRSAAKSARLK